LQPRQGGVRSLKNDKRSSLVLWSSVAAAGTAGIVALAAYGRYRMRSIDNAVVMSHLRDVQEVLSDCYAKIQEIENQLPDIRTALPGHQPSRS